MAKLNMPIDPRRDHIRGNPKAPISLVEYGDFECPYCGAAYPVIEAALNEMADRMKFAYRHFPLTQVHPHAELAAEAAEAAGAQGKFWEMHDLLFENQDELGTELVVRLASDLDLDLGQFERQVGEHEFSGRISEHFTSGLRSGVNGTPSLFINDLKYEAPVNLPNLLMALSNVGHRGWQDGSMGLLQQSS